MPPAWAIQTMTVLGVACLVWGSIAILFPRYSVIGSLSPREQIEESSDSTVKAHDPVTWEGMGREDSTFTVRDQRRAGLMVLLVGIGVLIWVVVVSGAARSFLP